jgi:uncharacterized protein (TIGR04255 family)
MIGTKVRHSARLGRQVGHGVLTLFIALTLRVMIGQAVSRSCGAQRRASNCRFLSRQLSRGWVAGFRHEPVVDAICEVRLVDATSPLVDLLPGFLFQAINPKPALKRTPAADMPPTLRQNDPNLQYQPVIYLDMQGFYVTVSERSFTVGCRLPYPKWRGFKNKIVEICQMIGGLDGIARVERYSLKYVNIIPATNYADQLSKIKLSIQLGDYKVDSTHVNLQMHREIDDVLHIITVMTGVNGKLTNGLTRDGILLDIDSIRAFKPIGLAKFAASVETEIESLRQANKRIFFSCLTEDAIAQMEPSYV